MLAALLLFGCGVRRPHPPDAAPTRPAPRPLTGVTVILDPGHGGADSGAVVGMVQEAALTYRAAVEVGQVLREQGASVVYTVKSKRLDPALADLPLAPDLPRDAVLAVNNHPLHARSSPRQLYLRAAVARDVWRRTPNPRRVFFLSLHFDDFHNPDMHGALVCVDRRTRETPRLAAALAREFGDDVASGRGTARLRLGVLNPDFNPVPERVLLEMATLSNEADALVAQDMAWRREMARRIAAAVTEAAREEPG